MIDADEVARFGLPADLVAPATTELCRRAELFITDGAAFEGDVLARTVALCAHPLVDIAALWKLFGAVSHECAAPAYRLAAEWVDGTPVQAFISDESFVDLDAAANLAFDVFPYELSVCWLLSTAPDKASRAVEVLADREPDSLSDTQLTLWARFVSPKIMGDLLGATSSVSAAFSRRLAGCSSATSMLASRLAGVTLDAPLDALGWIHWVTDWRSSLVAHAGGRSLLAAAMCSLGVNRLSGGTQVVEAASMLATLGGFAACGPLAEVEALRAHPDLCDVFAQRPDVCLNDAQRRAMFELASPGVSLGDVYSCALSLTHTS